jgi:hypothetical protein
MKDSKSKPIIPSIIVTKNENYLDKYYSADFLKLYFIQ